MTTTSPLSARRRAVYGVVNSSTAPLWLAMILAPRSRATHWLLGRADRLLLGLGGVYAALLAAGAVQLGRPLDFSDPDAVRAALGDPDVFLAGWSHYIAFDLFVGRWIWEDANAAGRTARLPLLLTWLAGPAGLGLHLARKARKP